MHGIDGMGGGAARMTRLLGIAGLLGMGWVGLYGWD